MAVKVYLFSDYTAQHRDALLSAYRYCRVHDRPLQ